MIIPILSGLLGLAVGFIIGIFIRHKPTPLRGKPKAQKEHFRHRQDIEDDIPPLPEIETSWGNEKIGEVIGRKL